MVNMEVVIEPLRKLVSESEYFSCPNHGSDRLPGFASQIESLINKTPELAYLEIDKAFYYSSEIKHETLYLQQRRYETRYVCAAPRGRLAIC